MEQLLSQLRQEASLSDVVRPLKLQSLKAKHALLMHPHKALHIRIERLDGSSIDIAVPRKCSFYQLRQLIQSRYAEDDRKSHISWRYIWKRYSIQLDASDQFSALFTKCSDKIVTKFGVKEGTTVHFVRLCRNQNAKPKSSF